MSSGIVTIYSLGDSDFMYRALNAVAMLTNNGDPKRLLAIGLLCGLIFAALKTLMSAGREFPFAHVLLSFIIGYVSFWPTATVQVMPLTPQPGAIYGNAPPPIANVPLIVALPGAILSGIGVVVTNHLEQAFNPIAMNDGPPQGGAAGFTSGGFSAQLELMASPGQLLATCQRAGGAACEVTRESMLPYIKDCVMNGVHAGQMDMTAITNSPGVMQAMQSTNQYLMTMTRLPVSGDPRAPLQGMTTVNCEDAGKRLAAVFGGVGTGPNDYTRSLVDPMLAGSNMQSGTGTPLGGGTGTSGGSSTDAIASAFTTYSSNIGSNIGNYYASLMVASNWRAAVGSGPMAFGQQIAFSTAAETAAEQRSMQAMGDENLYLRIMRPMIGFFETFTYALAPLMAFLIGLGPMGIQLAIKYFYLAIWVQLWFPILAIINLYEETQLEHAVRLIQSIPGIPAGDAGTSMASMLDLHDRIVDLVSACSLLAASTPAIALSLIYGGAMTATYLAGRFQGSDHFQEKLAAPDMETAKPFLQNMPQNTADPTHGAQIGGNSGLVPILSLSHDVSRNVASARTALESSADNFGTTFSKSLQDGKTWSADDQHTATDLINKSHSTAKDRVVQLLGQYGMTFTHSDDVGGAVMSSYSNTDKQSTRSTLEAGVDAGAGIGSGGGKNGLPLPKLEAGGKVGLKSSISNETSNTNTVGDSQQGQRRRSLADKVATIASDHKDVKDALSVLAAETVQGVSGEKAGQSSGVTNNTALTHAANDVVSKSSQYSRLESMGDSRSLRQSMGADVLANKLVTGLFSGPNGDANFASFMAHAQSAIGGGAYDAIYDSAGISGINDPRQRQVAAAIVGLSGEGGYEGSLLMDDASVSQRQQMFGSVVSRFASLGSVETSVGSANPERFSGVGGGGHTFGAEMNGAPGHVHGSSTTDSSLAQQQAGVVQQRDQDRVAEQGVYGANNTPALNATYSDYEHHAAHSGDRAKVQVGVDKLVIETGEANKVRQDAELFGIPLAGKPLSYPELPKQAQGRYPDGTGALPNDPEPPRK